MDDGTRRGHLGNLASGAWKSDSTAKKFPLGQATVKHAMALAWHIHSPLCHTSVSGVNTVEGTESFKDTLCQDLGPNTTWDDVAKVV